MRQISMILGLVIALVGTVPTSALVLFEEDFDDGLADGFQELWAPWSVVGGNYLCQTSGFENYGMAVAGDGGWKDYRCRCSLMTEGSINQIVRFRVQDTENFYEFSLRGDPFNDAFLYRVVGGTKEQIETVGFANEAGTWHDVIIEIIGSGAVVAVDGTILFERTDLSTYSAGGIALTSYSGGVVQWQNAWFDDVIVTDFTFEDQGETWGAVKTLYH